MKKKPTLCRLFNTNKIIYLKGLEMRDIVLERNSFAQEDIRPVFTQIYRGLRRINDPRKRCVLMTGNGFTLSLLDDLNLTNKFPCKVSDIFSENRHIKFIPLDNLDPFRDQPLWSNSIWPKLIEHINNINLKNDDIWSSLLESANLNHSRSNGGWSMNENSLGFELRWYLWFYFRNTTSLYEDISKNIKEWQWLSNIVYLLDEFNFTYITFNYDLFFDLIIKEILNQPYWPVINKEKEDIDKLPASMIPNIKIHGTIDHMIPRYGDENIAFPWMNSRIQHQNNTMLNHPLKTIENYSMCYLKKWPWLPELVPPGRPGEDLCHTDNYANNYGTNEIKLCDYLIVCGLSAAKPDTDEIEKLIASINKKSVIFHIDKNPLESAPIMSKLLKQTGCKYIPIKSSEIKSLTNLIKTHINNT